MLLHKEFLTQKVKVVPIPHDFVSVLHCYCMEKQKNNMYLSKL